MVEENLALDTKDEAVEDAVCEECVIPMPQEQLVNNPDGSSTLRCVKCPFCKEIVDAHMTKTSISCPTCKVTVNYN